MCLIADLSLVDRLAKQPRNINGYKLLAVDGDQLKSIYFGLVYKPGNNESGVTDDAKSLRSRINDGATVSEGIHICLNLNGLVNTMRADRIWMNNYLLNQKLAIIKVFADSNDLISAGIWEPFRNSQRHHSDVQVADHAVFSKIYITEQEYAHALYTAKPIEEYNLELVLK